LFADKEFISSVVSPLLHETVYGEKLVNIVKSISPFACPHVSSVKRASVIAKSQSGTQFPT